MLEMLLNFKVFVYLSSFCGLYRLRQAAAEVGTLLLTLHKRQVEQENHGSPSKSFCVNATAVNFIRWHNDNAFAYRLKFKSYECFLVTCEGEGCLYPAILQGGSYIATCTTSEHEVCQVGRQPLLGRGVEMTATCGPDCDAEPTTTEKLGIFKRRKRSVPEAECCYSDRCNHDSPCGSLTCSAEVPVAARPVHVAALLTCISLALLQ